MEGLSLSSVEGFSEGVLAFIRMPNRCSSLPVRSASRARTLLAKSRVPIKRGRAIGLSKLADHFFALAYHSWKSFGNDLELVGDAHDGLMVYVETVIDP